MKLKSWKGLREPWVWVLNVLFVALVVCWLWVGVSLLSACTRQQREIVRTVVDLVDQVCGDKDSVDECLGKAQAHRAAQRAGAHADAGAAAAPPDGG